MFATGLSKCFVCFGVASCLVLAGCKEDSVSHSKPPERATQKRERLLSPPDLPKGNRKLAEVAPPLWRTDPREQQMTKRCLDPGFVFDPACVDGGILENAKGDSCYPEIFSQCSAGILVAGPENVDIDSYSIPVWITWMVASEDNDYLEGGDGAVWVRMTHESGTPDILQAAELCECADVRYGPGRGPRIRHPEATGDQDRVMSTGDSGGRGGRSRVSLRCCKDIALPAGRYKVVAQLGGFRSNPYIFTLR